MTLLREYVASVVRFCGRSGALALVLMLLVTATEGIGLVLLVPLLALVGVELGAGELGRIAYGIGNLLDAVRLQPTLAVVLAFFLIAVTLRALLTRWENVVSQGVEYDFSARLREELYQAIARARWPFLAGKRSSDLVHVLTAEVDRAGAAALSLLYLLNLSLLTGLYAVAALKLSWQATVLALSCGLILLALLGRRVRVAWGLGEDVTTATRSVYAIAVEHLAAIKTIKVYGAERASASAFSTESAEVRAVNRAAVANSATVKFWVDAGAAAVLSVVVLAAREHLQMSAAALLLLIFLFARLMPRLGSMLQVWQAFVGLLPGFGSVSRLLGECAAASEQSAAAAGRLPLHLEIRLENVSYAYDTRNGAAVRGVNLVIPAGRITAIVGPSGAGKSTVADLVLGLLEPDAGRIRIDGRLLDGSLAAGWRASVGYVPQDGLLFHDTVRANLLWARPGATESEMLEVLRTASADSLVAGLPQGLDTVVGDRGIRLSAGERQRLMLARALLRQPELLVLDEATNALDTENEQRIRWAIGALRGRVTVLLITHRLSMVEGADVVYVLDNGRVAEWGRWTDLRGQANGRLRAMLDAESPQWSLAST